jgi:Tfp pilus assembly protein PilV
MMRTFSARLRFLGRSPIGRPARALASDRGDTLIEVIVSALLVALIVVGTFSGLDSTNKATALQRSRSQADALAQQDEDRLRSLPISTLIKLEHAPTTQIIEQGGTKYGVTSSAKYIVDNTATTSCSSTAPSAEYIQTASTVTWSSLGVGHPVVETGIVSPPPGTSLVVQVTNQLGAPVPGMEAQITGPANATAFTNANGCAILAVSPGEYKINVSQTSYVDQNWFPKSEEDSFYPSTVYLPAETTTKRSYIFALAARLNPLTFEYLNPTSGARESTKALNAILENGNMSPTFRLLRPEGSTEYVSSIIQTEKHIFPFPAKEAYTVFAGSCLANKPPLEEKLQTTVTFPAGGEEKAKLLLPSLIVDVWQGAKTETPKKLVTAAPEVFLSDTDEGCESAHHPQQTIIPTNEKLGALKYPGQPWGTYTVCVNVTYNGEKKHFSAEGQKNTNPKQEGTIVNLFEGGAEGKELGAGSCP